MKKVAILIILIMASGLSMYGQNSYKVTSLVKLSDIKEKNLQRVFYVFSKNEFLKLPSIMIFHSLFTKTTTVSLVMILNIREQ